MIDPGVETRALVGLGSNLDDPARQIRCALAALADMPRTRLVRHSRLYQSAPWGITDQPAFVNAAAELATLLAPRALLEKLLAIECRQGRHRDGSRWGPRTLDLDLLTWADIETSEPGLMLPHPRIAERAFVLVPLAELDADAMIPGLGRVGDLLERLGTHDCVPLSPGAENPDTRLHRSS